MEAGNSFELPYWEKNQLVIGIDEAGRGPLAGPVVVAGVVFPPNFHYEGINDSKKISDKKRRQLFDLIKKIVLFFKNNSINKPALFPFCLIFSKETHMYFITSALFVCFNSIKITFAYIT